MTRMNFERLRYVGMKTAVANPKSGTRKMGGRVDATGLTAGEKKSVKKYIGVLEKDERDRAKITLPKLSFLTKEPAP